MRFAVCDLCGERDSKHTQRVTIRVGKVVVGRWWMCLHCRTVGIIRLTQADHPHR